jgi:chemotaxis protein MotB
LSSDLAGTGAAVDVRGGNLIVTLPSADTFSSGSASLSNQGQETLKKIGRVLKERYGTRSVSIEGHTDNEPVKKSKFGSNWRLSVERALAVQHYLEEGCRVSPDKLRVVGYGPYRPLAPNDKESSKQKNRRVELVILMA